MNNYFKYSTLGLQMVFTILLFILLGRYLDSLFHVNPPWFTILFALLASVGSIIMLIKKVK